MVKLRFQAVILFAPMPGLQRHIPCKSAPLCHNGNVLGSKLGQYAAVHGHSLQLACGHAMVINSTSQVPWSSRRFSSSTRTLMVSLYHYICYSRAPNVDQNQINAQALFDTAGPCFTCTSIPPGEHVLITKSCISIERMKVHSYDLVF